MKLLQLVIGIGAFAALASCSKGFEAPSSYEEIQKESYTITFPKAGTAPMIIAVDPTQKWMQEQKSVPASWFYLP